MKIGFDNDKYLKTQSKHIMERIGQFDNKLYLEFGGKLFDDFHAARVLPGFAADSKLQMLMQLADRPFSLALLNAGSSIAAKIAMMAITTSNSNKVNDFFMLFSITFFSSFESVSGIYTHMFTTMSPLP